MATIVIADDSATTRKALRMIVEGAGHQVLGIAEDGLDAVRMADELKPDVLLLDMLMPQLDGVEVVGRLRANRPRVLMLSSVTSTEKIRAARDAGVSYYVLKPFTKEKVLEGLAHCLTGAPH